MTKDYFQFYSLNFPNFRYPDNSSKSNDFSPNHLRYIISNKKSYNEYCEMLPNIIKQYKIKFLVCKKESQLPNSIMKFIHYRIIDNKSGDCFYEFKY